VAGGPGTCVLSPAAPAARAAAPPSAAAAAAAAAARAASTRGDQARADTDDAAGGGGGATPTAAGAAAHPASTRGQSVLSWSKLHTRAAPDQLLRGHLLEFEGIQPFSQESHTPTVRKEFNIGLHDPAEADLEHFWNCCGAGFLGERL